MPRRIPPAAPGCKPQPLRDPCNDRPVNDSPAPPAQLLMSDVFFNSKDQPDIDLLIEHLNLEGALSQELVLDIIKRASDLFSAEPNLLKLSDPITVVGDIHGQYFDLVKLLEVGGSPAEQQYIFLGDYVDRGSFSIEVVILLFAYKIRYPKLIRMLRGNHECRQMTSFFNFREECEYKYNSSVYDAFMDAFDTLPLACTINGKFLAVHGGISPKMASLKAVNGVDRFMEPPREGLLCDLLWADPCEQGDDTGKSKKHAPAFVANDVRGCSYFYSFEAAAKFLAKNSLLSVIRAHEAQLEGYKMHKTNPATGFPSVITIFSAPNYCDCYNNKGAILKLDNSTLNILQFNCSPHPYYLPNFMDIFTWSMPFVIEKVTEMLFFILQPDTSSRGGDEVLPDLPQNLATLCRKSLSEEENKAVDLASRLAQHCEDPNNSGGGSGGAVVDADSRERMRRKVRTIARMARVFKTKRQENETVLRLGGMCPADKIASQLLLAGKEKMTNGVDMFDHAQDVDKTNDRRPDAAKSSAGAEVVHDFDDNEEEKEEEKTAASN
eukprot:TRINITY_DN694_c0_g1_i1.p1 TRINITY_DN694_c0_g1~~TRINITY_DN694_c0_g1_i1.p1  ORF type:complete len:551 (-),score=133.98 TRINITY_DN694_c0_g1_i1:73-1725(-)